MLQTQNVRFHNGSMELESKKYNYGKPHFFKKPKDTEKEIKVLSRKLYPLAWEIADKALQDGCRVTSASIVRKRGSDCIYLYLSWELPTVHSLIELIEMGERENNFLEEVEDFSETSID